MKRNEKRYGVMGRGLLAFCILVAGAAVADSVEIGRFPQEVSVKYTDANGLPSNDVRTVELGSDGKLRAFTAKGTAVFADGAWAVEKDAAVRPVSEVLREKLGSSVEVSGKVTPLRVNQVSAFGANPIAAATQDGLLLVENGQPKWLEVLDDEDRLWTARNVLAVTFDPAGNLWFGSKAGVACRTGNSWKFYTGAEGLPYNDFTCAAAGPNGEVWFGTHLGAVRVQDGKWAYRQGLRWLPDDDIRAVAVDAQGNAWFATAAGVGVIERRMMTLAEKAALYEDQAEKYIRRTEYGYLAEASVKEAGKPESGVRNHDSDNDGLWTAMYGAGECFAYGATKDPQAKDRAKRAFEALRFLQKVTQGCEFAPPKGYVARTVLPVDGPDPNVGRIEDDRRKKEKEDILWKVYEPRWPKSADGKWYWKSDTSSDELDGHYFFYPLYYDLVADTAEEKERVREVVRDLTDHLVEHNFQLVDHDGTTTRWGFYNPEAMNNDPMWWQERGLKSLSMLSYLAVAEHMTGDAKYGEAAKELIENHAYRANLMLYKVHFGPGSSNQSDDEMAFMSFYNLLKYAKDETLRSMGYYSFYMAWTNEQPEMNPFFNFAFAAMSDQKPYQNPYGVYDIKPWSGWLEDSMETLKGFPLDRFDWEQLNSHRIDIVPLHRQGAVEPTVPMHKKLRRGYLTNGKTLPVENRQFNHWNTDPWELDYGGTGRGLGSGAVFLLPYYMGLYHGFIHETK